MIVVPAFAKGKDRDPETVGGGIASFKALRAPHVGGGIDEPSEMQAHDGTYEDSPENPGPAANKIKGDGDDDGRHDVPAADPEMEFVLAQIGNVRKKFAAVAMHSAASDDPAHMGPQTAVHRGMRIAFFVGVLMMNAVRGNPGDRSAFQGQGAAGGEEIFHPFRSFVAAVREQAVITHTDAEAAANPPHDNGKKKGLPGKEKDCGDGTEVQPNHYESDAPIHGLLKSTIAFEKR